MALASRNQRSLWPRRSMQRAFGSAQRVRSNIVISRIHSAYFLGLPLISAANAEEESAFFGGSFSESKCLPEGRKAISGAVATAAEIARPRPRCAAGKSLFSADRRGIRRLDSAIYSLSQQKASAGNGSFGGRALSDTSGRRRKGFHQHTEAGAQRARFSLPPSPPKTAGPIPRYFATEKAAASAACAQQERGGAGFARHDWDASVDRNVALRHG